MMHADDCGGMSSSMASNQDVFACTKEVESKLQVQKGLEFGSLEEAWEFYLVHAAQVGFSVRLPIYPSIADGLLLSQSFHCSKTGCQVFIWLEKKSFEKWIITNVYSEHNHDLRTTISLEPIRQNNICDYWYSNLVEYFQLRLTVDTGFFYSVELLKGGRCGSVFWADGRSRFYASQFGDGIIFKTCNRKDTPMTPFVCFADINHNRQPVLLGCALIANESEECFTWVFQTWIRAMSCRHPLSIQADQDLAIRLSIARVFPNTHHIFYPWKIKANQDQQIGHLLCFEDFKFDYINCISKSKTPNEFDTTWNLLLNKYHLEENVGLKEMYQTRKSWVPLYIKGTFYQSPKPFFDTFLNEESPLNEFIFRYEKAINQRLEEEKKEDFNSLNFVSELITNDPMEKYFRSYYTTEAFKMIQIELLECYRCTAEMIGGDGKTNRYMVQNCVNVNNHSFIVDFNGLDLNVNCSCKMFESSGILCRHALKIFQVMNISEIPSRYIIHRWTKHAIFGIIRDVDSCEGFLDLKNLMVWALREESRNYIEKGASSLENFKLALDIMTKGEKSMLIQDTKIVG